ncbi:MAG: beta-lactamase family protein [Alphaproteobacteria bacterium]|nr:beta-lactamase family protein [Alphaproteobacteria bacterium]
MSLKVAVALAVFASIAVPQSVSAEPATPRPAIDAMAPLWLKKHYVPSVSIAVIEDGKLAWIAAYGEQSPGVPASPATLYNIASMTKPISAEVVMRLAAQGKLSLDEPMAAHWLDPDIAKDPRSQRLTPRLSLIHRTGFPNWRRQTNKVLTFKFDPDTDSSYSGEGYEYLARFVQAKLQEPFDKLAERLIFTPLGMTKTSYSKRDWFNARVALPFDRKFLEPDFANPWVASDLAYTTPSDYAKFMIAVMKNEGITAALATERLTVVDNAAPKVCSDGDLTGDACPQSVGFGLGWGVIRYQNQTVVMHGGSDPGVKTQGYFVPERGFGLIMFTNGENGNKVIRDAADAIDPASPYVAFLAMQAK